MIMETCGNDNSIEIASLKEETSVKMSDLWRVSDVTPSSHHHVVEMEVEIPDISALHHDYEVLKELMEVCQRQHEVDLKIAEYKLKQAEELVAS